MDKTQILTQRLEDRRGKTVVFLSHCLLNENTRYLGGACWGGCVREILEACLVLEVGIVQMPCPEQQAWGWCDQALAARHVRLAANTTLPTAWPAGAADAVVYKLDVFAVGSGAGPSNQGLR